MATKKLREVNGDDGEFMYWRSLVNGDIFSETLVADICIYFAAVIN